MTLRPVRSMTHDKPPRNTASQKILLLSLSFENGGVERDTINLANGFTGLGLSVTMVVRERKLFFLSMLDPSVRIVVFNGRNDRQLEAELRDLLRRDRPTVVLSAKDEDDAIAIRVKRKLGSGIPSRFYLRIGTPLATRDIEQKGFFFSRWLNRRRLRKTLADSDGIITHSAGVARELVAFYQVPPEKAVTLPNPTMTPDFFEKANAEVNHPWFASEAPPVIIAVGRLARVKDFPTLLRAFAILRQQRTCRLMILGDGKQKSRLARLADELGISDDVELHGFCQNPYAFLKRAALLAVSSIREGGPIVLIEALALGIPAVATDCPTGPREILQDGRLGRLTPPGDAEALAKALQETLDHPPDPEVLKASVAAFTQENSSRAHLSALGLTIH